MNELLRAQKINLMMVVNNITPGKDEKIEDTMLETNITIDNNSVACDEDYGTGSDRIKKKYNFRLASRS